VDYEEGMHLLEVLREVCGITTLKDGCASEGFCGCCTKLVTARPVSPRTPAPKSHVWPEPTSRHNQSPTAGSPTATNSAAMRRLIVPPP
jgi:hypothetical protein